MCSYKGRQLIVLRPNDWFTSLSSYSVKFVLFYMLIHMYFHYIIYQGNNKHFLDLVYRGLRETPFVAMCRLFDCWREKKMENTKEGESWKTLFPYLEQYGNSSRKSRNEVSSCMARQHGAWTFMNNICSLANSTTHGLMRPQIISLPMIADFQCIFAKYLMHSTIFSFPKLVKVWKWSIIHVLSFSIIENALFSSIIY